MVLSSRKVMATLSISSHQLILHVSPKMWSSLLIRVALCMEQKWDRYCTMASSRLVKTVEVELEVFSTKIYNLFCRLDRLYWRFWMTSLKMIILVSSYSVAGCLHGNVNSFKPPKLMWRWPNSLSERLRMVVVRQAWSERDILLLFLNWASVILLLL